RGQACRDVLARVVTGGKVSLFVGFVSVIGSVVIGTVMGLVAGYYRGFWDMALMRFVDVQLAMPFILLAITVMAILGGGLFNTIILLIVSQCVQYARLVRGSVLSLREREFILSARAIGVKDWRIIFQHLLPNLLGPVIVLMTLNVANNILLESSLTFLGLGVDPTIPSWGGMLADGRTYLQTAWWVSIFPGLAILFTVLGLNLLGDWLRDSLDPTGRTSR
ncbi:MAG: ABC transporter permease, partial [Brucella intermedia]